jgi:hypothetical protein
MYSNKKYTVFCSVCAEDPELFGLGLFLIAKNKVRAGRIPCGCASQVHHWTEQHYIVKVIREAESRDFKYEFLGFAEPFKGKDTKMILDSSLGITRSVSINNFLKGQNCRLHANMTVGMKNRKSDVDCVESFIRTGSYADGTNL